MELHALKEMIAVAPNHWWYRVRRHIVQDVLQAQCPPRAASYDLLDVGCGPGDTIQTLKEWYRVQGVEIADDAVATAQSRGLTVTKADLPKIPFPDNSFDIVMMLDVLEHIADDDAAVREVYRVLRPGGTFLVFVPAFKFLWSINDVTSKHFRRYTKTTLTPVIRRAGFVIARRTYFNTFLFPAIALVRLVVGFGKLPMKTEVGLKLGPLNEVLFFIFYIESVLLRFVNLPFGVSLMCVSRKSS